MSQTAQAAGANRFDVEEFIDQRGIGWREILTLVVCALVLFIDGFDMYFFGKILPSIAAGLGVESAQMRDVIFWTYVGMAIGAFIMPPLADRIGRKPVLAMCALGFGVLSIVAVFAQNVTQMAILRGISGIFFSAMLPIALALLSEMTPKHRRASFMAIALVGFSGGSAASGVVAAWLLEIYGWQIGFWLAGLFGFLALPLLLLVPESIAFRVTRNPRDKSVAETIRRMDRSAPVDDQTEFYSSKRPRPSKSGPMALLQPRYLLQTMILWVSCFLALGNIAILANWMPTYFWELGGVPIEEFAISAMIAFAGGAAGTLTIGWLLDRVNPYVLIACYFLIDAGALYMLGVLPFGTGIFLAAMITWNFCQVGGQTGINTIATLGYPPEMRSSGIGWAGGWGRIAGILLPFAGGLALEAELTLNLIMALIAIPAVVIAMLVLLLGLVQNWQVSPAEPVSASSA